MNLITGHRLFRNIGKENRSNQRKALLPLIMATGGGTTRVGSRHGHSRPVKPAELRSVKIVKKSHLMPDGVVQY